MRRKRRITALLGIAGAICWLGAVAARPAAAQEKSGPAEQEKSAESKEREGAAQDKAATDDAAKKREELIRLERAKRAAMRDLNRKSLSQDKATARPQAVQPPNAKAAAQHAGQAPPKPTVVLKPGEKPGIKFDMLVYDFGKIRAGSDVVHEYWFTNTGNGPLEILQVKPS
jgi:hypothetical protein